MLCTCEESIGIIRFQLDALMQLRSANEFHKLLLALKEESQKTAAGWNVRALTSQSKPKKEKLNVRACLVVAVRRKQHEPT